jgi:uncharacterized protein YerC
MQSTKLPALIPLEQAFAKLCTPTQTAFFFGVLLSPAELSSLRNRWSAVQMLVRGATQRQVRDVLKVSIATASRTARAIRTDSEIIKKFLDSSRL